ncbi:hypothetical protein TNCV_4654771 [Trichonephila clavipes]|nr:hypothetical protein TNCV_4654771 [Trichonephila clavipes]
MGNLPKHRVTLEKPFFIFGIDYADPVLIKGNKGQGTKSTKGNIALFVCLATKVVHIEAVRDLTTDSFIAALRRFSARRGAPRHIYSDNGTNFIGARRKLDEIRKLWLSLPPNEVISYYLSKSSIDWHFIPPSSPHFGGIWESGIQSVKSHPKRVLGETILTFEGLTTLLTQIEGLLNSRPLSHMLIILTQNAYLYSLLHIFLQMMPFFQFLRSFLQPPTTEIVESCYRISNMAFGKSGASTFSLPYNHTRNAGRPTKLEGRWYSVDQRGGSSWHMDKGSSSSSASRQRWTGSSCNCENQRLGFQTTCS